jgi:hypothetical protein
MCVCVCSTFVQEQRESERELDFSLVPGIEKPATLMNLTVGSSSEERFELLPVFHALKYNIFFHSLVFSNVGRREVPSGLAVCMRTNRTLRRLMVTHESSASR